VAEKRGYIRLRRDVLARLFEAGKFSSNAIAAFVCLQGEATWKGKNRGRVWLHYTTFPREKPGWGRSKFKRAMGELSHAGLLRVEGRGNQDLPAVVKLLYFETDACPTDEPVDIPAWVTNVPGETTEK
jgi:hypothetical protein